MAGNLVKSVLLKIVADDGDSEAKLDKITAKAEELKKLHPDIAVKVDTAAASAKLAVLRAELKDTARDEKNAGNAAAGFSDRLRALGSSGGALGGLNTGLKDAAASGSKFGLVMAGLNIATGLGEPLMAGLIVAAGGLAAGLTAGAAGLGIFGLVAKSVWSTSATAATSYAAAQKQVALASTAAQRTAGLKAEQAALYGLSGAQKNLAMHIGQAQGEWQSFTSSATRGVASVLVPALGLIPKVLSLMRPFLAPVEAALRGIVEEVSKGLSSQGFASFLGMLQKNAGPVITALAHAIGNVVVGIGGILRAFMPVSRGLFTGIDSLTKKFAQWGQTLGSHSGFQSLMAMFHSETPLAVNALKQLAGIIKTVVATMTGMSTFSNSKMLLQLAVPILQFTNALLKAHPQLVWLVLYLKLAFDGGRKLTTAFQGISGAFGAIKSGASAVSNLRKGMSDAEMAAADATGVWGTFGGKISGVVSSIKEWSIWSKIAAAATKVWTAVQAAFDVVMDANPIALIVIAVVALAAALAILIIKVKPVRDFFKAAFHDILAVVEATWNWVKSHWPLLAAVLLGPVGIAVLLITRHLHTLENVFTTAWHAITRVVSAAWNAITRVVSAAANAVGHLVERLWHVVTGLFSGGSGSILHIAMSLWNRLIGGQERLGEEFTALVVRLVSNVVHWFASLPGKIVGALSALPGMLLSAGEHAIDSLISGLASGIGKIGSVMGGIASKIAGFIGLSPAKEGPLAGGGAARIRGMHIGQDIAAGIRESLPDVRTAAMHLAGAAGIGGGAGARLGAPAAGTGPLVIEIHPPAGAAALGPEFMTALANGIRVRGGDPRILQRKVVFA